MRCFLDLKPPPSHKLEPKPMRCPSTKANSYASFLQMCTDIKSLNQLHARVLLDGLEQDIDTRANCGSLDRARLIFDKIYEQNVFLWNAIIRGYARSGMSEKALTLYHRMQQKGLQPNNFTFPFVLKTCADLSGLWEGKEIHGHIVRTGFQSDVYVGNTLVDMYAKCGSIDDARQVFDKMPERDVVSWTAMIAGYAQNKCAVEALKLFHGMQPQGVIPDSVTIVSVLSACASLGALQQGKLIHNYILRSGLGFDVFVGNSLVAMYAKCSNIQYARHLFDKMPEKDVVSWNAMIAGYVHNGHANEALALFHQMALAGVKPNSATMVSVIPSCALLGDLQQGKWIHNYVLRGGFELNVSVMTALVDMYAKCGCIETAQQLFDKMSKRNVISWNAMIAGCAQNGYANEALMFFNQMQLTDVKPNVVTMASVIQACAHLGSLKRAKLLHNYIVRSGCKSDIFVQTALIDMYAKCGNIQIARQVFDKMSERDVVSWSAMIAGYGMHGYGKDALALFFQMQQTGMKPNHITFVGILSACSHAGLVDDAWQYFECMSRDYCIKPTVEHYACMADLLGRAGCLDEAQNFIKRMPLEPDANVWVALLGACRIHCNIELGMYVAERLFVLEPKNAGHYVLLSNIYAASGRWDDVAKVRTMMKDRGLKKTPGCSLIEVNNKVHAFYVGDRSSPESEEIYATLEILAGQMKDAGYVPNTNFALHDVEEETKEYMLHIHSEKLAIAFGLINMSPGIPIQITKNLRMCGDCHTASKFISKIVKREIIVRDANRFHHFRDGLCSCGDYW